eukprot:364874-Chlamydomonas_euryale.AAC.3
MDNTGHGRKDAPQFEGNVLTHTHTHFTLCTGFSGRDNLFIFFRQVTINAKSIAPLSRPGPGSTALPDCRVAH